MSNSGFSWRDTSTWSLGEVAQTVAAGRTTQPSGMNPVGILVLLGLGLGLGLLVL